jgi:site-specific DNA-methyltransferase (adenine-specific)
MKPVRLMGRILLNSTKKLEVVLDPFAGSGSTLIAAEQLGRTSYMMELDPKFVEVIIDRYEKFTGNKAEKVIKEQWINENNNN